MKHYLVKISSIFFLTLLLASNIVNLHVYFHDQELSHCQNDTANHDNEENEEKTPCDICIVVFNLNNLDYNNSLEFSFENLSYTEQITKNEVLNYTELLHKQSYLNKNRNKAPPYLA